jgi:hypothetical protein
MAEMASFFYICYQLIEQTCSKEKSEPYKIKELLNDSLPWVFGGSKQRRRELKTEYNKLEQDMIIMYRGNSRNHHNLAYKPHGTL